MEQSTIDKLANDHRLSLRARGLGVWLLATNTNEPRNITTIHKTIPGDVSLQQITGVIRELTGAGFLQKFPNPKRGFEINSQYAEEMSA